MSFEDASARAQQVLGQVDGNLERAARAYDAVAGPHAGSVVLVGAGALGRHTARVLAGAGLGPLAFADNAERLRGSRVEDVPVLDVAGAVQRYGREAVFVVTAYNRTPLTRQLAALGCPRVTCYALLWARHARAFLPYFCLDEPAKLASQHEQIVEAASFWHDRASAQEFVVQLERRAWLGFDRDGHEVPTEVRSREYFADDVYTRRDDEVLVDCGAFSGDTVERFVAVRGDRFSKVVAIEPDPSNQEALRARVARLPEGVRQRVATRGVALGATRGKVRFSSRGDVGSAVSDAGDVEVESDTLDAILEHEQPTLIKMDIEGLELDALRGATSLLRREQAVLAISLYHRPEDLWSIPSFVRSIAPGYRLLLRAHAEDCWDSCFYAVPEQRLADARVRS